MRFRLPVSSPFRALPLLLALTVVAGCGGGTHGATPRPAAGGHAAATARSYSWGMLWDFRHSTTTFGWAQATVGGMPASSGLSGVGMGTGFLYADVAQQDAWILSPDLSTEHMHAGQNPWLVLRLRVKTPKPAGSYSLDIYWVTAENGTWGETQAVHTLAWKQFVNTDGNWHSMVVNIAAHNANWKGELTALRIDLEEWEQRGPFPQSVAPNEWDIQYLGLAKGPAAG